MFELRLVYHTCQYVGFTSFIHIYTFEQIELADWIRFSENELYVAENVLYLFCTSPNDWLCYVFIIFVLCFYQKLPSYFSRRSGFVPGSFRVFSRFRFRRKPL